MKKILALVIVILMTNNYTHSKILISELKNKNLETQSEWEKLCQNIKQGNTLPIGSAIMAGFITGGLSGLARNQTEPDSLFWIPLWYIERKVREAIITDLKKNTQQTNQFKQSMEDCCWLSSWITYLFTTKGHL